MSTTINSVQNINIYNNTLNPSKICSQCHQNKLLTDYNKEKKIRWLKMLFQIRSIYYKQTISGI